jgi:hypothetical protein
MLVAVVVEQLTQVEQAVLAVLAVVEQAVIQA